MGRPIDAESLLEHARRKPLKYSDEATRQTAWWFIHKFLPALVDSEPTVDGIIYSDKKRNDLLCQKH